MNDKTVFSVSEIDGEKITLEQCPKYLGVKLDKTLTYNYDNI